MRPKGHARASPCRPRQRWEPPRTPQERNIHVIHAGEGGEARVYDESWRFQAAFAWEEVRAGCGPEGGAAEVIFVVPAGAA